MMKKFFIALSAHLLTIFFVLPAFAQIDNTRVYQRCGTAEAIAKRYATDPAFKAQQDQRERDYQVYLRTGA